MLAPDTAAPKHVKFRRDVDAKYGDGASARMWRMLHALDERHDLVSCISIVKKAGDEIVYPRAVLSAGVAARETVLGMLTRMAPELRYRQFLTRSRVS